MTTSDSGHTPEIREQDDAPGSSEPWNVWTVPNLVSFLRLLGIPLFLWLVLVEEADVAAFVVLVLAGASDWIDGYLARRLDQRSRFGVLLDPAVDRLYILATLVGLALRDVIGWWLVVILVSRDLFCWCYCPCCGVRVASPYRLPTWERRAPSPCSGASRCCFWARCRVCWAPPCPCVGGPSLCGEPSCIGGRASATPGK